MKQQNLQIVSKEMSGTEDITNGSVQNQRPIGRKPRKMHDQESQRNCRLYSERLGGRKIRRNRWKPLQFLSRLDMHT